MIKIFYLFLSALLLIVISSCERPTDVTPDDDGIPPAVPAGFRIFYASDGIIIIEWDRNTEKDLSGYIIYRSINDSSFTEIAFTQNDYYYDDSLNYEDEYFYKISAVDFSGRESDATYIISAKPVNRFNPATPRFLGINARNWEGAKSIYLYWDRNEESDIAGYNIYRSEIENFQADSSSFFFFSEDLNFNDTTVIEFYKKYFYRIRAVDKGGLISSASYTVWDEIYEIPEIIFPSNNSVENYFPDFLIKAIQVPSQYKIVVQTNEFFGEFWSTDFSSQIVSDTISVRFNPPFLEANKKYFWRVATYSKSSEPNSISRLYNFAIKN